jgi:hypothetical protein
MAKINVSDGSFIIPSASGRLDPRRKPFKGVVPCAEFSIQNVGFTPLVLTLDSILRTGSDVDSGKITNPDDRLRFSVSAIEAGSLSPGSSLTIAPCASQPFCVTFDPLIPALANRTTGLSASEVMPDNLTTNITFKQNGGASITIPVVARVGTGAVFINAEKVKKPPVATLERNGNEFIVTSSLFDSNLDVRTMRYQFLTANGSATQESFDVDVTQPIAALSLVRGQSFTIVQRFSGASSHTDIAGVRITIIDGNGEANSVIATFRASPSGLGENPFASLVVATPPVLRLHELAWK